MGKLLATSAACLASVFCCVVVAQQPPVASPDVPANQSVSLPADYVIGADDVLSILYWREKDLSAEVTVRPDGKISLPLLNDVQAAGLTPPQLRDRLADAAKRYVEDANVTVVVKAVNSRKVYITGEVEKAGAYSLNAATTVLQLISMAGGLREYADSRKIVVIRTSNGKSVRYPFNYKEVIVGKNLQQNIELHPGDTVVVPD